MLRGDILYYTQESLLKIKKQRSRMLMLLAVIVILSLIMGIAIPLGTQSKYGIIIGSIGIASAVFLWGIRGSQIQAYYKYVAEIVTGRVREASFTILDMGQTPIYKDNQLLFYEVKVHDVNQVERTMLVDRMQGRIELEIGRTYTFYVHGQYILGEKA